jgi:hypothetical protein
MIFAVTGVGRPSETAVGFNQTSQRDIAEGSQQEAAIFILSGVRI